MSSATKRLSWALAISLGVNLVFVGFAGMRLLQHKEARAQEQQRRELFEQLVGEPDEHMRDQQKRLARAKRDVVAALESEPYNGRRAYDSLAELRTLIALGQELVHEKLLERLPKLSIEQRRELAKARFLRDPMSSDGRAVQERHAARALDKAEKAAPAGDDAPPAPSTDEPAETQ